MRTFIYSLVGVIAFVGLLALISPGWYHKNERWRGSNDIMQRLRALGDSALTTEDVPVAAIVLYKGQIIGQGYNTVKRDDCAGGHAEINAISAAIKTAGLDSFSKLAREQLQLITTWEPCLMCRGAIVEYDIKHVTVLKMKPRSYWLKQWRKVARYEWNKQGGNDDTLQDALFRRHPQYGLQREK